MAERILIGRIRGAHGIRGEVIVTSFAAVPEDVAAYGPLENEQATRRFTLTGARASPKGVIARIAGVADRTAAEALAGIDLYIERSRLPAPAEDEFYHADLIGLAAVSPEGRPIGDVVAVVNFGAGDLIEIRPDGGGKTELVPFTDACVPEVDLARRRIVVVPLPLAPDDGPHTERDPEVG